MGLIQSSLYAKKKYYPFFSRKFFKYINHIIFTLFYISKDFKFMRIYRNILISYIKRTHRWYYFRYIKWLYKTKSLFFIINITRGRNNLFFSLLDKGHHTMSQISLGLFYSFEQYEHLRFSIKSFKRSLWFISSEMFKFFLMNAVVIPLFDTELEDATRLSYFGSKFLRSIPFGTDSSKYPAASIRKRFKWYKKEAWNRIKRNNYSLGNFVFDSL